jgi:predicted phosphoadenosine phosphosulfate sulfurtransferase
VTEDPENYRGINILNTCYKIYSKILNIKLQSYSEEFITETQNGFRKGRSCTDRTFCLKLLFEKRREYNLETHLLFIDYEKAFDSVQRHILFDILKYRNITDTLLKAIVDTHTQSKISIKFNS